MNPVLIVTALGPILGVFGLLSGSMWVFWIGVALCALVLLMNLTAGAMKLPVLPLVFVAIGAGMMSPWYAGLGAGPVAWTAFESAGEVFAGLRRKASRD